MTKQQKVVALLQAMLTASSFRTRGPVAVAIAVSVSEDQIPDAYLEAALELWSYAHSKGIPQCDRPKWLPPIEADAAHRLVAALC